jgi:flagella synthesis protein FlgN
MTTSNPAYTLPQEQQALSLLVTTLQKEQASLNQAQVEDMLSLLTEKANLIADMTKLAGQRFAALEAAGFAGSEEGMKQWVEAHGTIENKQLLDELLPMAVTAKELNRLNGLLIGRHMSHNQQILDAVQNALQGGKIYGPDGQSTIKAPGRQLGIG